MQENESVARTVELSWTGRVRTGNKKSFDYAKDLEVICRFKEVLTREGIYKEIQKTNWPFQQILGMVLRPGGLVDFTLKSKDAALKFAKTLRELDSIKIATAHVDTVVEVRIDFIHRYNIQTGTRVFEMDRENLEKNPIPSYLFFGKYKFRTRYEGQHTTCGYCPESDHIERDCPRKTNMKILVKKVKMLRRIATTPRKFNSEIEREPSPTYEEVAQSFENNVEETKGSDKSTQRKEASKRPLSDSSNTSPTIQPQRKRNSITETELSNLFSKDVDISIDSSTEDNERNRSPTRAAMN